MKNTYYYLGANPTVDLVIINHKDEVLLIKRGDVAEALACPNMWAIPGGFMDSKSKRGEVFIAGLETAEEAALREAKEETFIKINNPKLVKIGIFEGNQRDPRDNEISWSKSHAFYCVIDEESFNSQKNKMVVNDKNKSEVKEISWKSLDEINQRDDIAFDHKDIINKAFAIYLANKNKKKNKLN